MTGVSWSSLAQSMAFVVLTFCFIFQVWDSMDKFLSEKTTTAIHSEEESKGGMHLPNIILCPGFRSEFSRDINARNPKAWPLITYYDSYPNHEGNVTQTIVEQWWKNITFDIQDFLIEVDVNFGSNKIKLNYVDSSKDINAKQISVEEVSSSFGRCYIIKSNVKFKFPSDYLKLWFNFTNLLQNSIALYLTPGGGESGLQNNYWLTDAIYEKVERGIYSVDFALRKEENIMRQNQKLCEDYSMEEWFDCVWEWERQQISNLCSFPQSNLVTRTMLTTPDMCTNKEDWNSSKIVYKNTYENHINPSNTGCLKPCHSTSFTAMKRQDMTKDTGKYTYLYIYFQTTRVLVYEEYLLFDFGSIVSAVGGSLGLFLGFSCWQMVKEASGLLHLFSKKIIMKKQG